MAGHRRQPSPGERTEILVELAGGRCAWCGFDLSKPQARPTRDHVVPKVKGGPTRLENEIASCSSCNMKRGHDAPSAWIERCRDERGLEPNAAHVAERLRELDAAIADEGGMRKIRPYVARELARVEQLVERG